MPIKRCPSCGQEKSIDDFGQDKHRKDGHYCYCKACSSLKSKAYYEIHPEKRAELTERARINYAKNPFPKRKQNREWNAKNIDKIKIIRRRWEKEKPEMASAMWRRASQKIRSTIHGKISDSIRRRINKTLKNGWKGGHWESLVGFTVDELKVHLEKQFSDGMSWGNYGKWHIDHIKPVSCFNYQSCKDVEFHNCWKLSNLQPLWAMDNMRKGNREGGITCQL